MNDMMKQLLKETDQIQGFQTTKQMSVGVLEKTRIIHDCIIIVDEGEKLDTSEIDFAKLLVLFKDWTGYEISCNELRFSTKELPPNQFIYFVETLNSILSQRYAGKKFGITLSLHENIVDLRFHTYRLHEGLWLDKDLNKFYITCNTGSFM